MDLLPNGNFIRLAADGHFEKVIFPNRHLFSQARGKTIPKNGKVKKRWDIHRLVYTCVSFYGQLSRGNNGCRRSISIRFPRKTRNNVFSLKTPLDFLFVLNVRNSSVVSHLIYSTWYTIRTDRLSKIPLKRIGDKSLVVFFFFYFVPRAFKVLL